MSSQPKISIQNLTFSYNGTDLPALTDINLDIQSNEITVLFGPAQSGTSTLLRLLNRLNDLIEGTTMTGQILLDGQDIYAPEVNVVELRRRVGMVFALPIPLPATIRENIIYGPLLSGVEDRHHLAETVERSLRAAALWDEVSDRLDESANALSGGQQQRLCLARVLALEPEVILLDNPTSGLDPISTAKVEGSLQALKRDYTIVMVPHSIQQAARIADTAAFLLMGELVEHAPGEELFTWPRDKRTEDYITGRFG
jgi:phosphate transport system ATP-binding protein